MSYRVTITAKAERSARENFTWWAANRSREQAERWFFGIVQAMLSLNEMPQRHGHAREISLRAIGVREMPFGIGRRPTHRVLYTINGSEVRIHLVRAYAQDAIEPDDLL